MVFRQNKLELQSCLEFELCEYIEDYERKTAIKDLVSSFVFRNISQNDNNFDPQILGFISE